MVKSIQDNFNWQWQDSKLSYFHVGYNKNAGRKYGNGRKPYKNSYIQNFIFGDYNLNNENKKGYPNFDTFS